MNPIKTIRPGVLAMLAGLAAGPVSAQTLNTIFAEDFNSFNLALNVDEGFATGGFSFCGPAFVGDAVDCGGPNLNEVCDPDGVDDMDPSDNVPATIPCPAEFDGMFMPGDVFLSGAFNGIWAYETAPGQFWVGQNGFEFDSNNDGVVDSDDNRPAIPGIGTGEWQGWSVTDSAFWLQAADQRRTEFIDNGTNGGLASGNIAVADADEWDDFDFANAVPSQQGVFNALFSSPVISLEGTVPGSAVIQFSSSWRDEAFDDDFDGDGNNDNNQTAILVARFDDGREEVLLRWESDPASPFFKDDAPNEVITLNVNNLATDNSVEFDFFLVNAGNDWWWAIDNIQVAAEGGDPIFPPAGFSLTVDTLNFTTLPEIQWTQAINAIDYLVEFANDAAFNDVVLSSVILAEDREIFQASEGDLLPGEYYVRVTARNNIGTTSREALIGVGNPEPADLNGDGVVDAADFTVWISEFNAALAGPARPGSFQAGVNGGVIYGEDFEGVDLGLSPQEAQATFGVDIDDVWSQDWASIGWGFAFAGDDGMDDWNGFALADAGFWATAAGQGRGDFSGAGGYGDGAVAIADGDEWDDADIGDANGPMITTVTSPMIALPGDLGVNTLKLVFAESFRSEPVQFTDIEVSFDGGLTFTNVLALDPNSGDQTNGRRIIDLSNPAGATDVQFRWTYEGVNDWWYAFDNITLVGDTAEADADRPSVFALGAPVVASDGSVSISYEESYGASSVEFQVSTSSDFASILDTFSVPVAAGTLDIPAGQLGNGSYFIRAVASNASGTRTAAGTASFVIDLSEGTVVYEEGFEAAVLGPSPQEDPTQLNVWTQDWASLGWSFTFEGNDGMDDWEGFVLVDGDFWLSADDQQRSQFAGPNGYSDGVVGVADGDEWDDADVGANGDTEPMLTTLTSPVITTPADTAANSLRLTYAESFRSEDPQTTDLEVSFNGGSTFSNILSLDPSTPSSPNGRRSILLNNPAGANQLVFRWTYEGVNDWWYALDNLTITATTDDAPVAQPSVFGISAVGELFGNGPVQSYAIERAFGAESYELQFSTDASFSNIIATKQVGFGTVEGPVVPNGVYFVRAVATNAAGTRASAQTLNVVVDNALFADQDANGLVDSFDAAAFQRLIP